MGTKLAWMQMLKKHFYTNDVLIIRTTKKGSTFEEPFLWTLIFVL